MAAADLYADYSSTSYPVQQRHQQHQHLRLRSRVNFTPEQVEVLEGHFGAGAYPSAEVRAGIAAEVDLTEKQVLCWFQNRRKRRDKGGHVHKDYAV